MKLIYIGSLREVNLFLPKQHISTLLTRGQEIELGNEEGKELMESGNFKIKEEIKNDKKLKKGGK